MPHVHPTAVLTGDVQLADDAVVGPYCVLAGKIRIGPGTTLVSHVHLHGPLWLGAGNTCYPGTCLGFAGQDLKFDASREAAGLVIGDRNVFREHVTIHRATRDDRPTTIGHRNYWMAGSHAGHDVQFGSDCIIGNNTMFGGHAQIADRVVFGGAAAVHQFTRIGRGCMVSGECGTSLDLCPFFTLTDINLAGSLNIVGMRRSGMTSEEITLVRWCYRTICRAGTTMKSALAALRERADQPLVQEYIAFLESAKRPIARRRGRKAGRDDGDAGE
ncbi:MAG: acyl-ACP--UDP-N-acetylglucosamine O-acyltransferase [Phycisphaerae bacterium]|nr:acyl-ACP--UDP-N-acetylglucosamine O-acyltransferase [Phycisphaerae bacterium]